MKIPDGKTYLFLFLMLFLAALAVLLILYGYMKFPLLNLKIPAFVGYRIHPVDYEKELGIFRYDFEAPQPHGAVFSNIARSGHHSLITDKNSGVSSVIEIPLSLTDSASSYQVMLSAWAYVLERNQSGNFSLIFAVVSPLNKLRFARSIDVRGKDAPEQEWFRISTAFKVQEYVYDKNDFIKIYLHCQRGNRILLDDLILCFRAEQNRKNSNNTDENIIEKKINPYPAKHHSCTNWALTRDSGKYLLSYVFRKNAAILSDSYSATKANIFRTFDFKSFSEEKNPKYTEEIKRIAGNYLNAGQNSLIRIYSTGKRNQLYAVNRISICSGLV